jgi:hypothetical protein
MHKYSTKFYTLKIGFHRFVFNDMNFEKIRYVFELFFYLSVVGSWKRRKNHVRFSNVSVVKKLLSLNPIIEEEVDEYGLTPLNYAKDVSIIDTHFSMTTNKQ